MKRIALVGKPNSGQRESAIYLQQAHKFKRMSMMKSVRKLCLLLYRYSKWERVKWEKQRAIYDALYLVDPNIWVTALSKRIELVTKSDVIVEDAKYLNEVEELRRMGFTIVRISAAKKSRADSIGRSLGTKIIPGTVTLSEYFNTDPTHTINVDYSIYYENSASLHKTWDELLKKLDI